MAGQNRGGNEGFSGTPLWKMQQQMAQYRNSVMAANDAEKNSLAEAPPELPNVIVDTVSVGGPKNATEKYVRSVLVKDFHKIAARMKIDLPKTNVFKDKAPCALYALFDGQSCAGEPGVKATEFCARNFHTKVLENLSQLPPNHATETFVKAALIKSFEDLDADLLKTQVENREEQDGCGAAVTLLVGDIVFTAVLGRCNVVLCEAERGTFRPISLGGSQRDVASLEERHRLKQVGASVIGDGAMARLRHPSGALSPVGRSLGDPQWKSGPAVISCSPEVQSNTVRSGESHPFLLLLASSITAVLDSQQLVDLACEYPMQPRAACGEVTARVLEATPGANPETQYTAIGVCFLPRKEDKDEKRSAEVPPAKRLKVAGAKATTSVRLRHVLIKYVDPTSPVRQVDSKNIQVSRTRSEAEALLRRASRELRQDLRLSGKTPKDVAEKVQMESKKFAELCREMSDCQTAKKGGAMCGDLGWMAPDFLQKMAGNFKENIDSLLPGQWSDITQSKEGLHLVQKVA